MTKFFLKLPKNSSREFQRINEFKLSTSKEGILFFSEEKFLINKTENKRLIIYSIGDLINPSSKSLEELFSNPDHLQVSSNLRVLRGHFYLILYFKKDQKILVLNSLFSILPIYFYESNKEYLISSNIISIIEKIGKPPEINKSFILERILFNYSFQENTFFQNINTLPSNSYLELDKSLSIKKHTRIEDYFISKPKSWKKSLDEVSNAFLENLDLYISSGKNFSTLTGGFDGRTIVGYLHYLENEYATFSYGADTYKDITVPQMLANNIGFNHTKFLVDDNYSNNHYIKHLEKFIELTEGNASLNRHHYSYVASEMSKLTNYFLSGNFGSETLRTMRVPGVMTSGFLFNIFLIDSKQELLRKIKNNKRLNGINILEFREELEILIENIFEYKNKLDDSLSINQKFYIYLFEEVFRKYFGPEFIVQQNYDLNNRSPYLDFSFIKTLLQTGLAGANGKYQERNPFIRFRGHILYSYILNKMQSPFALYPTDRGYAPKDFFSFRGKLNIINNYLNNNLLNKRDKSFTSYNQLCFENHIEHYKSIKFDEKLFNKPYILDNLNSQDVSLNHILSLNIYQNLIK